MSASGLAAAAGRTAALICHPSSLPQKGKTLLSSLPVGVLERARLRPLCLIVDNDEISASLILGAAATNTPLVLIPSSRKHLLDYAAHQTGAIGVIERDANSIGLADGKILYRELHKAAEKDTNGLSASEVSVDAAAPWILQWSQSYYRHVPSSLLNSHSVQQKHTEVASKLEQLENRRGVCLLTSSTTQALPKIVFVPWEHMYSQAQSTVDTVLLPRLRRRASRIPRVICASSIGHAYAINALFVASLVNGAQLALASGPEHVYDLIRQCNEANEDCHNGSTVTSGKRIDGILWGSPGLYAQLLKLAEAKGPLRLTDEESIEAYSAGCALENEIRAGIMRNFNISLKQNYGCTEMGNITQWGLGSVLSGRATSREQGSHPSTGVAEEIETLFGDNETTQETAKGYVGHPWPGVEVKLQPPTTSISGGSPILDGREQGEVLVRTPWQSVGYIYESKLLWHGHYHRTGDIGYQIPFTNPAKEGGFVLCRRLRPSLRALDGGLRVDLAPHYIEARLLDCPLVKDVVVFQLQQPPSKDSSSISALPRTLPPIQALVVLQNSPMAESQKEESLKLIHEHAASSLPHYACPVHIKIVADLPRTPAGKVIYHYSQDP